MKTNSRQVYREIKGLVEALLEDYPKYYDYVRSRKFELANPVAAVDENVGGGRAQNNYSNPIDRYMITTESDKYLNDLSLNHSAIRICYEEANEDVKTICEELYFRDNRKRKYHTIEALVNDNQIHESKSQAYREWDDFVRDVARQLTLDRFMNF